MFKHIVAISKCKKDFFYDYEINAFTNVSKNI